MRRLSVRSRSLYRSQTRSRCSRLLSRGLGSPTLESGPFGVWKGVHSLSRELRFIAAETRSGTKLNRVQTREKKQIEDTLLWQTGQRTALQKHRGNKHKNSEIREFILKGTASPTCPSCTASSGGAHSAQFRAWLVSPERATRYAG